MKKELVVKNKFCKEIETTRWQPEDLKKQASFNMGLALIKEELKKDILEVVKELSEKLAGFIKDEATILVKIERSLRLIEKCDPYESDRQSTMEGRRKLSGTRVLHLF